jgi:hypothetical protein
LTHRKAILTHGPACCCAGKHFHFVRPLCICTWADDAFHYSKPETNSPRSKCVCAAANMFQSKRSGGPNHGQSTELRVDASPVVLPTGGCPGASTIPCSCLSTPCLLTARLHCISIRASSVETREVHFASSNDHDHEQNTWQLTNNHLADLFKSPENHISFF